MGLKKPTRFRAGTRQFKKCLRSYPRMYKIAAYPLLQYTRFAKYTRSLHFSSHCDFLYATQNFIRLGVFVQLNVSYQLSHFDVNIQAGCMRYIYTIGNYAKILEFLNILFYSSFNRMECLHFLRLPHIPTICTMQTLYPTNYAYVYLFLKLLSHQFTQIYKYIHLRYIINCRTLLCKYNVYLQFRSSCAYDSIFVDYVIDVHVYIYIQNVCI